MASGFTAKKNADTQDFTRKTTKYWVHCDDIPELKSTIMTHLPPYNFSTKITNMVQSLYCDNERLKKYNDRIMMINGGMLFRYRWYGNGVPKIGFMEQKIRRFGWLNGKTVKRRFKLRVCDGERYMSGDYVPTADNAEPPLGPAALALSREIQAYLRHENLVPMVRTAYNRSAYQKSFSSPIRISFDENLQFSVVKNQKFFVSDPKDLHLEPHEYYDFAHGVLEIKVRLVGENRSYLPEWAQELFDRGVIMPSDKFSKYNSSIAILFNDRVNKIPYYLPLIEQFTPASTKIPLMDEDRGAPRSFMQLERTYLKWLRNMVAICMLGVALLGFQISDVAGGFTITASLLILLRVVYVYHCRLNEMRGKSQSFTFDDPYTPCLVTALFVSCIILQSIFNTDEGPFRTILI